MASAILMVSMNLILEHPDALFCLLLEGGSSSVLGMMILCGIKECPLKSRINRSTGSSPFLEAGV